MESLCSSTPNEKDASTRKRHRKHFLEKIPFSPQTLVHGTKMSFQWSNDNSKVLRDQCVLFVMRNQPSSVKDFQDEHYYLLSRKIGNGCTSAEVRKKILEMFNDWIAWKQLAKEQECEFNVASFTFTISAPKEFWQQANRERRRLVKFQNDPLTFETHCHYHIMFGDLEENSLDGISGKEGNIEHDDIRTPAYKTLTCGDPGSTSTSSVISVMSEIKMLLKESKVPFYQSVFFELCNLMLLKEYREMFTAQPSDYKLDYVLMLMKRLEKDNNISKEGQQFVLT